MEWRVSMGRAEGVTRRRSWGLDERIPQENQTQWDKHRPHPHDRDVTTATLTFKAYTTLNTHAHKPTLRGC